MKVQLATRLDTGLRQRLRIYAAVTGRTVEDVVSAALDGYLPPTSEMVRSRQRPREELCSRNSRGWRDGHDHPRARGSAVVTPTLRSSLPSAGRPGPMERYAPPGPGRRTPICAPRQRGLPRLEDLDRASSPTGSQPPSCARRARKGSAHPLAAPRIPGRRTMANTDRSAASGRHPHPRFRGPARVCQRCPRLGHRVRARPCDRDDAALMTSELVTNAILYWLPAFPAARSW